MGFSPGTRERELLRTAFRPTSVRACVSMQARASPIQSMAPRLWYGHARPSTRGEARKASGHVDKTRYHHEWCEVHLQSSLVGVHAVKEPDGRDWSGRMQGSLSSEADLGR